MKIKHLIIVSLILAIITIGAASAADDSDALAVGTDDSLSVDDIDVVSENGNEDGGDPADAVDVTVWDNDGGPITDDDYEENGDYIIADITAPKNATGRVAVIVDENETNPAFEGDLNSLNHKEDENYPDFYNYFIGKNQLNFEFVNGTKYSIIVKYFDGNYANASDEGTLTFAGADDIGDLEELDIGINCNDEDDYLIGDYLKVTVEISDLISNNVTILLNDKELFNITISDCNWDSEKEYYIYEFDLGDYDVVNGENTIKAVYDGDDQYSSASDNITVNAVFMKVDIHNHDSLYMVISLADNTTGTVEIFINGTSFSNLTASDLKDYGYIDLDDLPLGDYNYTVTYRDDEKYSLEEPLTGEFEKSYPFYVIFDDEDDEGSPIQYYLGDEIEFEIRVPSKDTGEVIISYNGKTIKETPNDSYWLSVYLSDWELGENEITFTYNGTGYPERNITESVYIEPFLYIPEEMAYGTDDAISLILPKNATGNLIVYVGKESDDGEEVNWTVIGNVSVVDGKANFSVSNFELGTYNVKAEYEGDDYADAFDEEYTEEVRIVPYVDIPLVVYFGNESDIIIKFPENYNSTVIISLRSYKYDYDKNEDVIDYDKVIYNATAKPVLTIPMPKLPGENHYRLYINDEEIITFEYSDWVYHDENMTYGESIHVDLDELEGYVDVFFDGKYFDTGFLDYGYYYIPVNTLKAGSHTYEINYYDMNNVKQLTKSGSFNLDYRISTNIWEESYPLTDEFELTVEVPEDVTGNVVVYVNGEKYTATPVKGTATLIIKNLVLGQNNVSISYDGDNKYPAKEIKETINVDGYGIIVNYDEDNEFQYVSILLPKDANGTLVLYEAENIGPEWEPDYQIIGGPVLSAPIVNGSAKITRSQFEIGTYVLVASYEPNDEEDYGVEDEEFEFKVLPEVNIPTDLSFGDNATIKFTIPNATGVVYVYEKKDGDLNLITTIESNNGTFEANLTGLGLGQHEIILKLDDENISDVFEGESYKISINPIKAEIPKTTAADGVLVIALELPEGISGKVTVISYDDEEKDILVRDIPYNSTNKTLTVTLDVGSYNIEVIFEYENGTYSFEGEVEVPLPDAGANFTIPTTVDSGSFDVVLPKEATGGILVTVDGKTTYIPLVNGTAKVDLSKLAPGNHNVTVKYPGDNKYGDFEKTAVVNVPEKVPEKVPAKITANGLSMIYTAGTKYTVTVYGTDGKVAANTPVTFLINGKAFKTVKTDAKGVASVKITQKPGSYKITSKALGVSVVKKLTVRHVLKLKKVKVKRSAKKLVIKATLAKVNGKYLKGKKIILKFKGKKYTAKTDKKGVAKFTIKKNVLKKLKKGKKVTYQATYLKDTVKYTVKVK